MFYNITDLYNTLVKVYSLVPYHLLNGYSLPPVQYLLYVTRRCNLRCQFCFFEKEEHNHDRAQLKQKELSTQQIQKLIDNLPKVGVLTLTGGEPFMRQDLMEILTYSSRRRRTHLISNGTLIKKQDRQRLITIGSSSLWSTGLVLLGISLPGFEKQYGVITGASLAYEKVLDTVRELVKIRETKKQRFPLLNLKTVISARSLQDLPKLYRLADEIGVDIFNVLAEYALPVSRDTIDRDLTSFNHQIDSKLSLDTALLRSVLDELTCLQKHLKPQLRITPSQVPIDYIVDHYNGVVDIRNYYCHSPWAKVEISPYGDVYPCLEFNAGNVLERSFLSIWNGSRFRKFRKELKRKRLFQACKGCCNIEKRPSWLGISSGEVV